MIVGEDGAQVGHDASPVFYIRTADPGCRKPRPTGYRRASRTLPRIRRPAGRASLRSPPLSLTPPETQAARSIDGRPEAHPHDPRRELTEAERAARPAASDRTRSPLRPPRVRGRRAPGGARRRRAAVRDRDRYRRRRRGIEGELRRVRQRPTGRLRVARAPRAELVRRLARTSAIPRILSSRATRTGDERGDGDPAHGVHRSDHLCRTSAIAGRYREPQGGA